jgi:MFS transporter, DHA1 family, inner membrane transport protein
MPVTLVLALIGFASAVSLRNADPILPLIASEFSVTIGDAALLATAYTLPYGLMQLVLGPVGDAIGKARLIRTCSVVLAVALSLSALAPNYPLLLMVRSLAGAFAGGLIPVAMAVIGDRVEFQNRQLAMSRFLLATLAGQLMGAASSGVIAELVGWRAVFGLAAVIMIIAGTLAFLYLTAADTQRHPLSLTGAIARYRDVFRNPRSTAVFASVGLEGLLFYGHFPFIVVLLELHASGGLLEAGFVIMGFAAGGIIYTALVRLLIRAVGRRRMLALGGLIGGLSTASATLPLPWLVTALLFVCAGFGFFMMHNTLQTEASELAPQARASAFAVFASLLFLGQGIGVIAVGRGIAAAGLPAVMIGLGILQIGLGLFAAWKIGRPIPEPVT